MKRRREAPCSAQKRVTDFFRAPTEPIDWRLVERPGDAVAFEDCVAVGALPLPLLGFGTYALGRHAAKAVSDALQVGYRLIDTAQVYERGRTEQAVGKALKAARQKVFVTTKVWRPEGFEKTMAACEQSLKSLGGENELERNSNC